MNEPVQAWYNRWLTEHKDTNLIYATPEKPQLHQVHFVRDTIAQLFWNDVEYDKLPRVDIDDSVSGTYIVQKRTRSVLDIVRVIGEHKSKSVRLPVFQLARDDYGLMLVMRYNFHDWNISVVSSKPIEMSLEGYGATFRDDIERDKYTAKGYWGYLFFQGFPTEFMFGPRSLDARKFSLACWNDYELYSFVRALVQEKRKTKS